MTFCKECINATKIYPLQINISFLLSYIYNNNNITMYLKNTISIFISLWSTLIYIRTFWPSIKITQWARKNYLNFEVKWALHNIWDPNYIPKQLLLHFPSISSPLCNLWRYGRDSEVTNFLFLSIKIFFHFVIFSCPHTWAKFKNLKNTIRQCLIYNAKKIFPFEIEVSDLNFLCT